MLARISPHVRAVLLALLVTFLWSTSWVLIKWGLEDIPALTFAGLRYTLAFLCLVPFALRSGRLGALRGVSRRGWGQLIALGLVCYTVAQGSSFVALAYLPAITLSLLLNFTTIATALLGILFLAERPTLLQWAGIAVFMAGVGVFFYPVDFPVSQVVGVLVALLTVLANAVTSVLGRGINRSGKLDAMSVTVVSMGIGSVVLLVTGIVTQGVPALSFQNWLIILWLAVVNSAFAFTLWNHTLRTLSATESSIINNTMLIQVAVLAWIFLDERITWQEALGMVLAAAGTLIVQLRFKPQSAPVIAEPEASTRA